jgi:site-specific recombinase XerD
VHGHAARLPPTPYGRRLYAAIVLMWQGALRAFEALAVTEADLDDESGRIQIRHGKGDKQAMIRMAQWAWPFLDEWRAVRRELPNPRGPLLCVIDPPTAGRAWSYPDMRRRLKDLALEAGIAKRVAPHQLRHGFAVQAYEASVPLRAIQLHLRHENIGVTDTYLQGLGADESLERVYQQAMPTVPAAPRRASRRRRTSGCATTATTGRSALRRRRTSTWRRSSTSSARCGGCSSTTGRSGSTSATPTRNTTGRAT